MLFHSLQELILIEQEARQFGFDWPHIEMIIEQAESECAEIREVLAKQESKARLQEEIGDLLHTAISLCIFAGFDVDNTLEEVKDKFQSRIMVVKKLALEQGLDTLKGQSIDKILSLWHAAKESNA